MRKKDHYNVLAVYSLLDIAGRQQFQGVLDAIPDESIWNLSTVQPDSFSSKRNLVNEKGEPYDGFILTLPGADAVMAEIARSHTPTVLVNITDRRLSARCDAVASVWLDNADIGHRAARHLLERGKYLSAGYVHELKYQFYSVERMTAFRQTMKRGGCKTWAFPDGDDFGDFFRRLRAWVKALPKPAAVMAVSDMRAADVISACKAEGIAVPTQVAVVGVDHDVPQHAKCGMSISSVINNQRLMGQMAVRELDFLFRHPKWKGRPHEILIPANSVFCGESTALSPSSQRLVEKALDFIAKNHMRRLTPSDVFAHLGCSRQLANLRFSQVGGTTIHAAIEKARMEEVQRRIRSGEKTRDIVKSMQFASTNQLYRIYKHHFGHTLRQENA